MKTLFVMRHAKSSWDNPPVRDFSRPLAPRGLKDIPKMAKRLLDRDTGPEAIVCSPAERTLSTAILMAGELGLSPESVSSDPELYFAGSPMLLRVVSLFDDERQAMMLVGHNPAVTDFVNELGGLDIEHVPTSGIVQFELPIDRWQDVASGKARCVEFEYPSK